MELICDGGVTLKLDSEDRCKTDYALRNLRFEGVGDSLLDVLSNRQVSLDNCVINNSSISIGNFEKETRLKNTILRGECRIGSSSIENSDLKDVKIVYSEIKNSNLSLTKIEGVGEIELSDLEDCEYENIGKIRNYIGRNESVASRIELSDNYGSQFDYPREDDEVVERPRDFSVEL